MRLERRERPETEGRSRSSEGTGDLHVPGTRTHSPVGTGPKRILEGSRHRWPANTVGPAAGGPNRGSSWLEVSNDQETWLYQPASVCTGGNIYDARVKPDPESPESRT
jgi:hypothetical protein